MTSGARSIVSIHLRMPGALHRRLVRAARRDGLSLNNQIVHELEGQGTKLVQDLVHQIAKETAAEVVRALAQQGRRKP